MPNANLQRDIVSIAKAEEISFVDLKVIHERHGVVRRLLGAERQSAMSAVRPCLDGDDLPGPCQGRQDLSKRGIDP
jgi:hypothetical protein